MLEKCSSRLASGAFIKPKKRLTGRKHTLSTSKKLEIAKKMIAELETSQADDRRQAEKAKENFRVFIFGI